MIDRAAASLAGIDT